MAKETEVACRIGEAIQHVELARLKITGAQAVAICWEGNEYTSADKKLQIMSKSVEKLAKIKNDLVSLIYAFEDAID